MRGIGNFFDKIKSVALLELQKRVFVVDLIKKEIGFDIDIKDIKFKDGCLYINTKPTIKSQIFIKKGVLLAKIPKSLLVNDIR